jgi:hypothetical protein
VFVPGKPFQPSLVFASKDRAGFISFQVLSLGRFKLALKHQTSGLYFKHVTIVNYTSSGVNKLRASLNDDARVVIYNRHMFIVQATDWKGLPDIHSGYFFPSPFSKSDNKLKCL